MGSYKANNNNYSNKGSNDNEKEKIEKVGSAVVRGGFDIATGGAWENVRNKPIIGRIAKHGEKKYGKKFANSPGVKAIKNLTHNVNNQGVISDNVDESNSGNINDNNSTEKSNMTGRISNSLSKKFGLSSIMDSLSSSDGSMKRLSGIIPKSLKIKIIIGLSVIFLFSLICIGVFASDDTKNLSLTDGTKLSQKGSASSADLLAKLEDLANYFIENAGEYNQGAYLHVPQLDSDIRKDCTGFAVAYMSYVSGVDLPESYSGEMVEINGSWAKKADDAGWKSYTAEEIGDVSNLLPGDVLIQHSSGTYGHAEIYVDQTHTFGWGIKQTHYPLDKTIVNTSTGSKVRFGDGYHSEYRVVYRYMNATSGGNIDISDLNIIKMSDSSFNHGTKSKSNQKYIMLHDTEMSENASTVVSSWKNSGNGVAAHFVVDRDGTIIQAVDLDIITHHAGWGGPGNYDQKFGVGNNDGKGNGDDLIGTSKIGYESYTSYGMNSYSVGIEMCHVNGENYTEAQLNSVDKVIAYIDSYFGFNSTIIDHKEWRPSNSDTDSNFSTYLSNYKNNRHH